MVINEGSPTAIMDPMSDPAARLELPDQLLKSRAVVLLPVCRLDEAIAPIEVLLQEGFGVVSLPPDGPLTPAMLRSTFGRRLTVAVHDVRTADQARWAVEQRAAFALSMGRPDVIAVLTEAGLPQLPAALTPTEVDEVWRGGAAGVQVVPAGLFGNSYAAQLAAMVPEARLLARGVEASHELKAWLAAGAVAVCLGERLLGDALRRGDLGALRTRARPFVEVLRAG